MIKIETNNDLMFVTDILVFNKHEKRQHLKCLNVSNGKINSTNGVELRHMDNHLDLEDGMYEVIKRTKNEIILIFVEGDYPDVTMITGAEYVNEVYQGFATPALAFKNIYKNYHKHTIDPAMLLKTFAHMKGKCIISLGKENGPLFIRSDSGICAYLMPQIYEK